MTHTEQPNLTPPEETRTPATRPAPGESSGLPAKPSKPPGKRRRSSHRWSFDIRRHGKWVALAMGVLLLFNVAFWYLGVRPGQVEIEALEEDERTAGLQRQRAQDRVAELEEIRGHAIAQQDAVEKFYDEDLSTRARRSVSFQRALGEIGEDFRVRPARMNIQKSDLARAGIETMGFSFPISGGYGNLRKFLARLESLDQFLIVREVSLSGGDDGGMKLKLQVELETYFNAPNMRDRMARFEEWRAQQNRRSRDTRRRR